MNLNSTRKFQGLDFESTPQFTDVYKFVGVENTTDDSEVSGRLGTFNDSMLQF